MKINRLELENFRSFDRAELQLDGKSTVISGMNGTGKTSVLTGINLLYANIVSRTALCNYLCFHHNCTFRRDIVSGLPDETAVK